jgi:hypothetical protein
LDSKGRAASQDKDRRDPWRAFAHRATPAPKLGMSLLLAELPGRREGALVLQILPFIMFSLSQTIYEQKARF